MQEVHSEAQVQKIVSFTQTLLKKTAIPNLQLQNFLSFQYSQLSKKNPLNCCTVEKAFVSKYFKRAFKSLTRYQQACYYSSCVKLVVNELYKKIQENEQSENGDTHGNRDSKKSPQFQKITILYKREGAFKKWLISKASIAVDIGIMRLEQTGQQLDLQNYIVRMSKSKHKDAIVLESIQQLANPTTLRISNYEDSLDELKDKFKSYMDKALEMKISRFLKRNRATVSTSFNQKPIQGYMPASRSFGADSGRMLEELDSSKQVTQPATVQLATGSQLKSMRRVISEQLRLSLPEHENKKIHLKLVTRQQIFALSSFKDYQQIEKGLFYNRKQEKTRKIFNFGKDQISYEWLVTQMNCYKIFKKWKLCLFSINLLAELPNQKTKIYHEINLYKDYSQIDYVFLRHLFEIDGVNYYIDKSIETEQYGANNNRDTRGCIDYCLWRFRRTNQGIQILVQLKLTNSNVKAKNIPYIANQHIGEVSLLRKQFAKDSGMHAESFRTIHNSNLFLFEDQSELSIAQDDDQQQQDSEGEKNNRNANVNEKKELIDKAIEAMLAEKAEKAKEMLEYRMQQLGKESMQNHHSEQSLTASKRESQQESSISIINLQHQTGQLKNRLSSNNERPQNEYMRSNTQFFSLASSEESEESDIQDSLHQQKEDSKFNKISPCELINIESDVRKLEQIPMEQIIQKHQPKSKKISDQQKNKLQDADLQAKDNLEKKSQQSDIIQTVDAKQQQTNEMTLDCTLKEEDSRYSRHQLEPNLKKPGKNELRSSVNGHYIWKKEWVSNEKGQLINVNKKQIQVQSGVLKLVLRRMGRNLLSGKSILNISLPVELFGPDTNLERLCKSTAYAPRYLQEAVQLSEEPVQRMKRVIGFGIGFSLLYIDMQKPFNPILGQTYQGTIDGCPVYGEQISHHPPISSVLLKGRGYSVYGNYEAKVQMGMNSVSGINEGTTNISFSNSDLKQNLVKFNCPAGQVAGLIYGDRILTLTKKSYYYDQDNLLLVLLQYGSKKTKGNPISHMNDYMEGKMVKLKGPIDFKKADKVKQSDFQTVISKVYGRWTGEIFFDQVPQLNIGNDAPYLVKEYKQPLASNCLFRKDLRLKVQCDDQLAQQAKQELEQIQRNDRKLRKKYSKK